jgi:hypothetical protein
MIGSVALVFSGVERLVFPDDPAIPGGGKQFFGFTTGFGENHPNRARVGILLFCAQAVDQFLGVAVIVLGLDILQVLGRGNPVYVVRHAEATCLFGV